MCVWLRVCVCVAVEEMAVNGIEEMRICDNEIGIIAGVWVCGNAVYTYGNGNDNLGGGKIVEFSSSSLTRVEFVTLEWSGAYAESRKYV